MTLPGRLPLAVSFIEQLPYTSVGINAKMPQSSDQRQVRTPLCTPY